LLQPRSDEGSYCAESRILPKDLRGAVRILA
jgi:hypothetical protein